ncbi:MAG: ArnT family glycosyltransferase, partial [Acidimicrobiales bacterium]
DQPIQDRPISHRPIPDRPPEAAAPSGWSRHAGWAIGVGLVIFTVALRLVNVGGAYDLVQDEVNYVDLGTSLGHGVFPPVFSGSGPFLLHPPLFFALGAGWQMLFHPSGGYFHLVATIRVLNVVCAGVSAGCLYALGTRLGRRITGVAALLLFALDPYVLRQNGRALLETSTVMFVLLGSVLLVRLCQERAVRPRLVAVTGGLLLGVSLVGKDMAALLVVPPLLVLFWRRWELPRRLSSLALVASVVPFAAYVVALAAVGSLPAFWSQETAGIRRLLGQEKSTGFSKAGSPSLVHTIVVQLTSFGATYVVLGLGVLGAFYVLVRRHDAAARLMSVVTLFGAATIFYALFFGTIEEQFLYFLLVPALLSLAMGGTLLAERVAGAGAGRPGTRTWAKARLRTRARTRTLLVLLAIVSLYNLGVWAHVRRSPDHGLQRVTAWCQAHDPNPGLIGNDTQVTVYALQHSGLPATLIGAPRAAAAEHIRYLTVLPTETAGNYGALDQAQEKFYEDHGRRVFSFHEATFGDVQIYRTTDPSVW